MEIGNQMQNHRIETNSKLIYEDGNFWSTLFYYQNNRQRYTVIPITTVRGPLSCDFASGSKITSCNKIDKPQVVYRFSGNAMTPLTTLRK